MARVMIGPAIFYDLHTVVLRRTGEGLPPGQEEAANLDWLIGERRTSDAGDLPVVTVTVRAEPGSLMIPDGLKHSTTEDGHEVATGRDGQGRAVYVLESEVKLTLEPGGDSIAEIAAGAGRGAIGDAMVHALDHALAENGQCLLHAASLLTPDGKGMVLLHARSGTGKTTTAMALALAGFRLSGDDTVALGHGGDGSVMAWGLPRWAKIHERTVAMLPELARFASEGGWDRNGEQMVSREALLEAGLATPLGPVPVVAVISLVRTGDGPATITEAEPFDAMRALLEDNVSAGPEGFLPGHEARFDIFADLVACCRRLCVPVSGSPDDVADRIAQTLGY